MINLSLKSHIFDHIYQSSLSIIIYKFYLKKGDKAFEHLCLVTAGMMSQTPGENHITAQMKGSLDKAKEKGWAGNMLQEWISSALYVSKEIKNVSLRAYIKKGRTIDSISIEKLFGNINNFKKISQCFRRVDKFTVSNTRIMKLFFKSKNLIGSS